MFRQYANCKAVFRSSTAQIFAKEGANTQSSNRIRPVAYGLSIYLFLSVFDALAIPGIGSMLKIAALIPLGAMIFQSADLRIRFHPLLVLQVLFWLLAVISLFYSVSITDTLSSDITLTLNLVLVLALGTMVPYNEKELELLQKGLFWSCWLQIAFTLIFSDYSAAGRLTVRFGESAQDQNNNNTFFLYAFSFHSYALLSNKKKWHSIPVLILFAIMLLSGSRGAFLAYLVTFLFHVVLPFRNSKHFIRNLFLTGAVVVVGIGFYFLVLSLMPESVSMRFSVEYLIEKGSTGRTKVWRYLLSRFKDFSLPQMFFGNGYGTTSVVNQLNQKVAHNLYIDNLITLGLTGVLLQIASQTAVVLIFLKKKKYALLGAYIGMICMCFSLSLTACKPLWNMMLIGLALDCNTEKPSPIL